MSDLLKIADALEKAAEYFDAVEAEKNSAAKEVRTAQLKVLIDKYATATGEELPPDVAEKLAAGDASVLKTVQNIVEKTAGAVESLGRSSPRPDEDAAPQSKSDRAQAAWNRFGSFINS